MADSEIRPPEDSGDFGECVMTSFGVFVREPETNSTIYHLSRDDEVALCGRRIGSLVCIGEVDEHEAGKILTEIHTSYVLIWRCCEQCEKKLAATQL